MNDVSSIVGLKDERMSKGPITDVSIDPLRALFSVYS